ncbi:helix-turn-helix transcriptional regulator [Chitiniphilus eburneus]|uniref:DNA-binding protein n=1 Tax=Chitiniphilus eburneus TaxID=2571148 RepID=A0A4U0PYQ8_9NEIS|nr:hypothetical protein [Chitiniphilus eburneus]TJZ73783.1 hypothetical protein FAZ21_09175 [Chitiniphilus eburneus]
MGSASIETLIGKLDALCDAVSRGLVVVPPDKALWDAEATAKYLGVSDRQVAERYASLPDFPRPIYLPTATGQRSTRRWKAAEVIKWAESKQERKRS